VVGNTISEPASSIASGIMACVTRASTAPPATASENTCDKRVRAADQPVTCGSCQRAGHQNRRPEAEDRRCAITSPAQRCGARCRFRNATDKHAQDQGQRQRAPAVKGLADDQAARDGVENVAENDGYA
jgi:hypothetical protein